MAVRRNYRINLRNYGNPPAIMVSQYDENYDLVFEVYDGVVPATGLNAYTVKLVGRQPGDDPALKYEFTGTVSGIANNILSFTIDTTMTGRAGKGTAEIVILDTTNDVKFASFNLPVYVEKAAVPDDAIDADVERAQEIADEVQDIVDTAAAEVKGEAESWAVGERDGEPVPSTDPTYHNNAKYYSEVAQDIADSIGIDATLSISGKAADAKKTGDEISSLKEDLNAEIAQTNSRFSEISDKLTVRKTVSGTSFSITDCAKSGEVDAAEVEQSGAYVYVGGNMLPAAASASKTHRGITVTSNGDGTYHISGTSTGSSKVSFDLPETFTIQAGMYIHLLNSEQVNSSSIAFGDSDGQISGGYVGFFPKGRIFQVLSTSSLIGKTITTIFVSIGITEAVDFTIAPMLLWDSEEKDYSGYYPEVAYAEGEGLALNVGYNHIRTSAGSVAITYSVAGEDFVTKPIMAETLDSYAEKTDVPELIADYEKSTILTRNRDIIPLIDACTKSAHNAGGQSNVGKRFSLLVMTDTHGDYERVENAIDYLNAMPQIDAGIHLGDIVASNWASAYEWFETAVQKSEKPFYIALGNHDGLAKSGTTIGASVTEQFNRYIYPNLNKIGSTDITKTYYAIKNDTYKVVLIVLHLYDVPSTQSGGEYVISRGMPAYSQAQVDWLIDTLASVPTNYHVMIAQHCVYEPVTADNNEWRNIDSEQLITPGYNYTNMIAEIVKAWINGESHTATYTAQTSGLPNITVNANFLTRGAGVFAGYLIGHTHRDQTGVLTEYPDQHYYCFDTSANDTYQTEWSDLPRHIGTKSEDCISVVSIDTDKKRVCLVRVGSNRTFDMTNRDKCVISYE